MADSDRLRVLLLGPVDLRHGEVSLPIGGSKARSVLAMLALAERRVVPADQLIDGIWGEDLPGAVGNALQYHVGVLRKALTGVGAGDRLQSRSPGYHLDLDSDLADFHRDRTAAEDLAGRGAAGAPAAYARALAHWRGPALADLVEVPFAAAKATALDAARLGTVEALIDLELAAGQAEQLVPRLEELVAENPTRERFWGHLMTALYRSGNQAGALQAYARARRLLDEELGVEPGPELQQVQARVLAHDRLLDAPQPQPAPGLRPAARGVSVLATQVRSRLPARAGRLVLPDGTLFPLGPMVTVIGRQPDCDVVLDDLDVSRKHAEIAAVPDGPGHAVTDLGSTNGTLVNGRPLTSARVLQHGDRLELGQVVIRYEAVGTA